MSNINVIDTQLNRGLVNVPDGTIDEFEIGMFRGINIVDREQKRGELYYPFALENTSGRKYKIHHLPTGTILVDGVVGKKKSLSIINEMRRLKYLHSTNFPYGASTEIRDLLNAARK